VGSTVNVGDQCVKQQEIGILPAKPMDVTRILPAKTSIFEQQKWRLMAGTMVI